MKSPLKLLLVASALLPALAPLASRADVTLVTQNKLSGLPGAAGTSQTVTITTYYKGTHTRIENGAEVILSDADKPGVQTMLDTVKKTYYTRPLKVEADALAGNPMTASLKMDAKVFVHPGGQTKTIAGKTAKNYKFNATITMANPDNPQFALMLPTVTIKGEQWTTDALTLPLSVADRGKALNFASGGMMGAFMSKGMKEFGAKMGEIKGLPLSNTTILSFVFPEGSPIAAMAGDSLPKSITSVVEVKSLSEDPLADTLFAVPDGYTKVDPPAPPAIPGTPGTKPQSL